MKLLVVQTGFLGDVVLSTPVIRNLKAIYPEAEISFLTTPAAKELIEHHPLIAKTLVYDKRGEQSGFSGLLSMARELRAERFDAVFSIHKSYRTAVLLRLAGIKRRYGFKEAAMRWLYSQTAKRKDLPHEVLRNLAILRNIRREPEDLYQDLHIEVPEKVSAAADELLASAGGKPVAGIAPGSVWATKRWTVAGFVTVANEFLAHGFAVAILGGEGDAKIAEMLEQGCSAPVMNLAGKTSLIGSTAIIDKCSLLVTNDSAPLHLASARGTPAVAVFCATSPAQGYGPWGIVSESVSVEELRCRPCGRHGGQICPNGSHACQLDLPASQVIQACKRVLGAVERRKAAKKKRART